ncbi:hypothetical protein L218DRAFT_1082139 [Marasmius fiardii PR-910]|nr:hypothetical protein L218DRAFT_1082139 [Marasmius fiardii PR-910]
MRLRNRPLKDASWWTRLLDIAPARYGRALSRLDWKKCSNEEEGRIMRHSLPKKTFANPIAVE